MVSYIELVISKMVKNMEYGNIITKMVSIDVRKITKMENGFTDNVKFSPTLIERTI